MKRIALIDPAKFDWLLESPNLGDQIISRASKRELSIIYNNDCEIISIPSHSVLTRKAYGVLNTCDAIVVGGSNLFWFRWFPRASWPLRVIDAFRLRNVHLMGVGWGSYEISVGPFGKFISDNIFTKTGFNSFRDNYSVRKAEELGITNPIFTGCQTCWVFGRGGSSFKRSRKKKCVFTLTDYAKDVVLDKLLIQNLISFYGLDNIYFWPQGANDLNYLMEFNLVNPKNILPRTLKDFEGFLKNTDVDYVGTRLHGGILALEYGKRSIIIAIDNRAIEMGKDLGLVTVERPNLGSLLQRLESEIFFDLKIPSRNVKLWSSQLNK